jgi:hypothetical protein
MCRTSGEAAGPVRRDAEVHDDGEQTELGAPVLRHRPKERDSTCLILYCTTTANEGPVKILYKCLVPIYVFPEMKLLFPKQSYNVLSPSSYTHISVRY